MVAAFFLMIFLDQSHKSHDISGTRERKALYTVMGKGGKVEPEMGTLLF